ncbi:acyl-CoA dehydratase activase [uncultured Allofournierella sp.]|uniref:acyl-CoA dehydratase activase n=1 Tax=uncultured Allofournierella sp. TaxID=1940258 RepID=UPI0037528189
MKYNIGIDIGSTCAKTIVMDEQNKILHRLIQPTGWSSVDTAQAIRTTLEQESFALNQAAVVATGYGRVAVPFANKSVTEITCHAKGACYLHGMQDLTIVDIGGQDTKIITVAQGSVTDFLMNDKCSAGTGRFLEVMANTLGLRPQELCELAAQGSGVTISSLCTVFAVSEVISLIGKGEQRENIAYGVVHSIVQKVGAQAKKLQQPGGIVCMTGGLCQFEYLRQSLAQTLGCAVEASSDGRYAGAIGAALVAHSLKGV